MNAREINEFGSDHVRFHGHVRQPNCDLKEVAYSIFLKLRGEVRAGINIKEIARIT